MRFESTEEIQDLLDKTRSVENRLLTILYLLNGKFTELQTLSKQLKTYFQVSQQPGALASGKKETENELKISSMAERKQEIRLSQLSH